MSNNNKNNNITRKMLNLNNKKKYFIPNHKKRHLHISKDNSNNIFIKNPLQLITFNKDIKKKDINSKNIFLSMEFEDIIDNIRKEQLRTKKVECSKKFIKISKYLDDNKRDLPVLNTKSSLNRFLMSVNNNYQATKINFKDSNLSLDKKIIPIIPKPVVIEKTKIDIECDIKNIKDLLELVEKYPIKCDVEYNINIQALKNIKEPLKNLDGMVGMNELKNSIVDQILYYIQDLNKCEDFMHTVIYGPPGTGKTEIAKLMGKIFASLGILKNKSFKKATRADLIAGYLGQTALKTKQMIQSSLGGVLFIDEAYALGNNERRDSFAKECIDTLCETLSDYKSEIMVIVAGYEKELDECFFSYNKGLDSRFPWRFKTDDYNSKELKDIFIKKVNEIEWKVCPELNENWFEEKMEYFKFYGRDMETLLSKIKIAHSRRVFCKKDEKKYITLEDLNNGFNKFINNNEVKERKQIIKEIPNMYL